MSKFDDALHFAIAAHAGMVRKGDGTPYILHPLEVASIASSLTSNEDVLCAAVLHDVVEDTPCTLEQLHETFGGRVAELVAAESESKREEHSPSDTWMVRKLESLEDLRNTRDRDVLIIWLSDKLSNMRSFARMHAREGDAMWERFNQHDPALHAWLYREIGRALSSLSESSAWQEYVRLTEEVFEGIETYDAAQ